MATDTLLIKHFPCQLNNKDKVEFLKQCGAVEVKALSSKVNKYNATFARFPSETHAEKALHHLHQQEVLGSYLVAEYARGKVPVSKVGSDSTQKDSRLNGLKASGTEELLNRFLDKLNKWSSSVDFRCPIPSHLRYHYPPPSLTTLQNITHQLANNPPFYTQVLHLMNKMNLPCPIGAAVPVPATFLHQAEERKPAPPPPPPLPLPIESSESESELSEEDGNTRETIPDIKPKIKKTLKRPKLVKPLELHPAKKSKRTAYKDVFEDPSAQTEAKKKLPKLVDESKEDAALCAASEPSGFGFIHPVNPKSDEKEVDEPVDVRNPMEEERLIKPKIDRISLETLAANRVSERDRSALPVYKNYTEGAPTCRLYIKNLGKQTSEEDLRFIYSRFLSDDTLLDSPNIFDIRLMQEGRMKGQAFVTLQTVELAKKALAETNGYLLNDKPMVVQFARCATK